MNVMERMKLKRQVAMQADKLYTEAKRLGETAATSLGGDRRSQMTGLESVANNALAVSDVLNYIKTRTARSEPGEAWRKNALGKKLLEFIEQNLKVKHRRPICRTMNFDENSREAQQVHLHLIRAFIHQLVVHYEYETKKGEMKWS